MYMFDYLLYMFYYLLLLFIMSGAVAESGEHMSQVWEIMSSNNGRVKPMTYKINIPCFLAR